MGDIGLRYYFFDGDRIMRVGVDTKKRFPNLAGRQVPWVTVIYLKSNKQIQSIRFDPANINEAGEWTSDIEDRYAAQVMQDIFTRRSNKVASLRASYMSSIKLTDSQKEILRNRIDRDFGVGTWNSIAPKEKALLWSTRRTYEQ
jgi:DMSO/TMAO reductase YedYZ molybdopterin-dependent catalytic subunit